MTIRIGRIVTGLAMVLTLTLVGCGGGDAAGDSADAQQAGRDAPAPGAGDEAPAQPEVQLLGRWEVLSQNGTLIHPGELIFTFMADGTGSSLEGEGEKAFTWVHDPGEETLHILTENEDMLFRIAMAGETLTLSDSATTLVLRRAAAPGTSDVQ